MTFFGCLIRPSLAVSFPCSITSDCLAQVMEAFYYQNHRSLTYELRKDDGLTFVRISYASSGMSMLEFYVTATSHGMGLFTLHACSDLQVYTLRLTTTRSFKKNIGDESSSRESSPHAFS